MEAKTWNTRRPAGGGGVDVLRERAKARALALDGLHDLQEVLQRPGQPVILGDHHHVAGTELARRRSSSGDAGPCR
jgi:hypothetical protein